MRRWLPALLIGAAASCLATAAAVQAQEMPRTIRIVLPFAAGGAADVVTRLFANAMAQPLGAQVVVDNRTGASGIVGTEHVMRSPPDGSVLLVGTPATAAINPWVFRSLPYDIRRDFTPVTVFARFAQVLVVTPSLPVRSVADLVAHAKARPGALNFATSGIGSTAHLMTAMLMAGAGIEMVHVPYRGGGPGLQAVMSGEVQVLIEGVPSLGQPMRAGAVRALGVTTARRVAALPDLPAIGETVPGFDAAAFVMIFAPAGTPAPVIARIAEAAAIAGEDAELKTRLASFGAEPGPFAVAEAAAYHAGELEKWRRAVEVSGAKLD